MKYFLYVSLIPIERSTMMAFENRTAIKGKTQIQSTVRRWPYARTFSVTSVVRWGLLIVPPPRGWRPTSPTAQTDTYTCMPKGERERHRRATKMEGDNVVECPDRCQTYNQGRTFVLSLYR